MAFSLTDPLVQSALLPLAISLIVFALAIRLGGARWRAALAPAGIGIALLISILVILGVPPFPPRASIHKLPYLLALSLALGIILERLHPLGWLQRLARLLWPLAILAWLTSSRWSSLTPDLIAKLVLLYAVIQLVLWRLATRPDNEITAPVMVLCASLGLGGIVLLAASASTAQLSFALSAATGGFLICNWPRLRAAFGHSGLYGAALPLLLLASQSVLFTKASLLALALLLPLFFADQVSARLPMPSTALAQALKPLYLTVLCLMPVALALTVAYRISGPLNTL